MVMRMSENINEPQLDLGNNTLKETKEKLTKSDLRKVNFRWLLGSQIAWNYERMMSTGYIFAMLPVLRKIYKDDDELREVLKSHLQFFNTNPSMGHMLLGTTLAIEEEMGYESKDVVTSLKTGLMGPLAGIGDTIFGVIASTVFGSIAAYMALEGSYIGVLIWTVWYIVRILIRLELFNIGYKQGVKLVTTLSDKLKHLSEAATVLGLTVIGALIPTVVKAKVPYIFTSGDVKLEVQEILNQIMPSLIPISMVALIYWLLGKKFMNSTRAIFFVLILSIILYSLKILA